MHVPRFIHFAKPPKLLFNTCLFSTTTTPPPLLSSPSHLFSHYFFLLHASPNLTHLRHLHARLLRTSLYTNVILTSKLILSYSRLTKLLPYSLSVFQHMPNKNIYSWNIIIGEFSRSDFPHKSIELFVLMLRECERHVVRPDDFSFPLVLRACARAGEVKFGVSAHGLCLKLGFGKSLYVGSSLVSFYVTFGDVFSGRKVFDKMPKRDALLWTAMLAGYAQHGEAMLGLGVFREMVKLEVEVVLDSVVMVSLLSVCGQLGRLRHGESVHGWCVRNCLDVELNLGNAIVDMYVKCGNLVLARRVFDWMNERDVFSWSSLILGYGWSGNVGVALELFDQMRLAGVKPNEVTFLGVLSACAHGGLVEQARTYFSMIHDYGMVAELKHYANMVDCLGRAGRLEEAERLIEEMPMEPDAATLGALLAGCQVHNNVEVGERIAKKLIKLEPEKAGYYVLLSNMYAAANRFEEAEQVRILMAEKNMSKIRASSLIETQSCFPPTSHSKV